MSIIGVKGLAVAAPTAVPAKASKRAKTNDIAVTSFDFIVNAPLDHTGVGRVYNEKLLVF